MRLSITERMYHFVPWSFHMWNSHHCSLCAWWCKLNAKDKLSNLSILPSIVGCLILILTSFFANFYQTTLLKARHSIVIKKKPFLLVSLKTDECFSLCVQHALLKVGDPKTYQIIGNFSWVLFPLAVVDFTTRDYICVISGFVSRNRPPLTQFALILFVR